MEFLAYYKANDMQHVGFRRLVDVLVASYFVVAPCVEEGSTKGSRAHWIFWEGTENGLKVIFFALVGRKFDFFFAKFLSLG